VATADLLSTVSRRAIVLAAVAVLSVVLCGTALSIVLLRELAVDRAQENLANLARVLAEHTQRSIHAVDVVLAATAADFADLTAKPVTTPRVLHEYMRERAAAQPDLEALIVMGPDGSLVSHSHVFPAPPTSYADRDYFLAHRAGRGGTPYVGMPILGRLTPAWQQTYTRRIEGRQGEFLGVVGAGVRVDRLHPFYQALRLGPGSRVAVFRVDGVVLNFFPPAEGAIGRSFADHPVFATDLRVASSDVVRRSGFINPEPRFIAYERLRDYPVVVTVSSSEQHALAGWREGAITASVVAGGVSLLIVLAVVILLREHGRRIALAGELEMSGDRLHGIIQSAMDAIITVDEGQNIVLFNAAAERIFGCPAREAVGGPLDRFIPARFREVHRTHIEHFGATGTTTRRMGARQALSGLRANGEEFPIDASISQIRVGAGKLYTVILRDVTETRRSEMELQSAYHARRAANEQLLGIIQSAMDAIITVDASQRIVVFNETAATIFRCRAEEAIGAPLEQFIPERFRAAHRAHIERFGETRVTARAMGAKLQLFGLRADGEEFPIDASISQVTVDGEKFYTVILRDVSERRRIEAKVLAERDAAQRYLDVAGVMLVALDTDGVVTLINRKGCEILGYGEQEIVGRNWFEHFVPESHRAGTRAVFAKLLSGDPAPSSIHENPVLRRGGTERLIDWRNQAISDEDGRIVGALSSGEDITERKATQEALERSYRELRELSQIMNEVREGERTRIARELHDELAQWLTALKMDVAWLGARLPAGQAQLLARAERMKGVVDTTVAAVRRIASDLRPVMIDDLGLVPSIEHLLGSLAERTNITVRLEVPEDGLDFRDPLATAVYRMVQEALTNVARHAHATEVRVSLAVAEGLVLIRVVDNGVGLPASSPGRKSYGLLGIRERAQTLGGEARIFSPPEGGTVVEISIPLARYAGAEAIA
jgi:PAS domain S-box-containing protein